MREIKNSIASPHHKKGRGRPLREVEHHLIASLGRRQKHTPSLLLHRAEVVSSRTGCCPHSTVLRGMVNKPSASVGTTEITLNHLLYILKRPL